MPKQLKPVPRLAQAAGAVQESYRLGTRLTLYEVLDPSASNCDKFLEATRAEELCSATPSDAGAFDDLVDYGTRRARAALQRIGAKSGALPFSAEDATGYCVDFIRRKLVAARILQQNLHKCDWSPVSKASLQDMSADAKKNLESIPDTYNASEISSFFTGRADWGLFASVFPCLWGGRGEAVHRGRPCPGALARQVEGLPARRAELSANRGYRSPILRSPTGSCSTSRRRPS